MAGNIFQSRKGVQSLKNGSKETDECISNMDEDSDSNEIGSYCELTLIDRQNSQNEEKEACNSVMFKEIKNPTNLMDNPQQDLDETNMMPEYKETTVLNIEDTDRENFPADRNKSKFSSVSTDWKGSSDSNFKSVKSGCSSCLCTITLSTIVSICVSASVAILLVVYLTRSSVVNDKKQTVTYPAFSQVS